MTALLRACDVQARSLTGAQHQALRRAEEAKKVKDEAKKMKEEAKKLREAGKAGGPSV